MAVMKWIEQEVAAAATALKVTFDKVFSVKEGSDQLTEICDSIGTAVEAECQMRYYEKSHPI